MSIRYRSKRSSGPVHEPIPAHPDAIYRPQNRPIAVKAPLTSSDVIAPRAMANDRMIAAPLAAGGSSFSPWWIIGPLLALIAAMAIAALAYAIKKKHDSKKQVEEENDPGKRETNQNKEENSEDRDRAKKSPIESLPLRNMKSDTKTKEQKRTTSMSSTVEDKSISSIDPFLSNAIDNKQIAKSALPVHGLPSPNDGSPLSSTHPDSTSHHPSINKTRMTKPVSDVSKESDEKNTSKTVQNTFSGLQRGSSRKNIHLLSTDKTEPNYSGSLPLKSTISPTSSTASTIHQPNDESELNTEKLKSNANSKENENQANEVKKTLNNKSPFEESLTNLRLVNHNEPLRAGQSHREFTFPSSRTGINEQNAGNKTNNDYINSPVQHGVGKSPLISNIPTGSKRSEKGKPQSRTNQIKERKSSSKLSSSIPNLQRQHSPNENPDSNKSKNVSSPSDINEDKQPSILPMHSKHPLSSEPSETTSSNSVTLPESTNEKNPTSSHSMHPEEKSNQHIIQLSDHDQFDNHHLQSFTKSVDSNPSNSPQLNNLHDDKSNESNISTIKPLLTNPNKTISLMPNVPQCKTNTSSDDDDDYDEIYPIPPNDSATQQTTSKRQQPHNPPSNLNINASTYRKKRTLPMHRSLTKRFHLNTKK